MNKKITKALEASITHHKKNIVLVKANKSVDIYSRSCPLCEMFIKTGCYPCPVYIKTKRPGCAANKPWLKLDTAFHAMYNNVHLADTKTLAPNTRTEASIKKFIEAEELEIAFLESLRKLEIPEIPKDDTK